MLCCRPTPPLSDEGTKLTAMSRSYLDLLFVHFFDYTTSIPELMHSLNDEVRSGRVNYIGISDTPGR